MEPTMQPIPADSGSDPDEDDKSDKGVDDGDAPEDPTDTSTARDGSRTTV